VLVDQLLVWCCPILYLHIMPSFLEPSSLALVHEYLIAIYHRLGM